MNEKMKLEKVIEGLKEMLDESKYNDSVQYNPWADTKTLEAALSLLKAQEPGVMTWRDVIGAALECNPVYIEVKDSEDKDPGDDRWDMLTQYKDSITNGMIRAMSSYVTSEVLFADWYNKSWRCWTSRPTDEQREAVKWDN